MIALAVTHVCGAELKKCASDGRHDGMLASAAAANCIHFSLITRKSTVTEQQRNARFALTVLFGVNLMNFFDRTIVGALAEPIRIEFGLNDTALGGINTVFVVIYAIVGLPLGRLTDAWVRTRLIAIGVTIWSFFTAASGAAQGFWSFLAMRVGVGVGEASCAPAGQSLIGDLYPPERRARAMAVFMLGLPLGLFLAYLVGGKIGERWGWRAALYVACVPGLILAVLMLRVKEPARGVAENTTMQPIKAPLRSLLGIPTLWWIVLSGLLLNFNTYAVNAFQSPFLQRFHGLSLGEASTISSWSLGLVGIVGLVIGGWLGDRLHMTRPNGRLLLPAVSMSLAAPSVFFALQQPQGSALTYGAFMAIATVMNFVYNATVYSAIQDVVSPRLRGTAVAVYFLAMYVLGAAFGTVILGALSDLFAHQQMLAAGAVEMAPAFRAAGLHSAMYIMPVLLAACAVSLFGAAATVASDARRMQQQLATA
jgi:predicted MFS family arabinose efflux permease